MSDPIENLIQWRNAGRQSIRTIVPGIAGSIEEGTRERSVDFNRGIADLIAGEPSDVDITPSAPVLSIVGGGFFCLLPTQQGDEMLGLVSDRSTAEWRLSRTAGKADVINGKRTHNLSDILLTPFAITAPAGAPETWDHLVIGGPSGVALEVNLDGSVVITKSGAPVATINLDAAGSVTIEVQAGQSVNLGGPAAVELPKWPQLEAALDTFIAALVAAGAGPTYAGAAAAQTAWNAAKTSVAALKAKAE